MLMAVCSTAAVKFRAGGAIDGTADGDDILMGDGVAGSVDAAEDGDDIAIDFTLQINVAEDGHDIARSVSEDLGGAEDGHDVLGLFVGAKFDVVPDGGQVFEMDAGIGGAGGGGRGRSGGRNGTGGRGVGVGGGDGFGVGIRGVLGATGVGAGQPEGGRERGGP